MPALQGNFEEQLKASFTHESYSNLSLPGLKRRLASLDSVRVTQFQTASYMRVSAKGSPEAHMCTTAAFGASASLLLLLGKPLHLGK